MIRRGRRRGLARRGWEDVDHWALDLEMSGLNAASDHILSVGMVPVRDRAVRVGAGYATLVGPGDSLAATGMTGVAAHHLLPSQVAGAPGLPEVVAEIDGRIEGAVLVVHAAGIDLPFLRRAYRTVDRPWPDPPVVDTLGLLRRHERHRALHEPVETAVPGTLFAARILLGLPPHDAHDAFADAVATAELLLVLAHRLGARTVGDLL